MAPRATSVEVACARLEKVLLARVDAPEQPTPERAPPASPPLDRSSGCVAELRRELAGCANPDAVTACYAAVRTLDDLVACEARCESSAWEIAPSWEELPGQVVLREAGCTITVAAIVTFDVRRGGYRSAEWIARLPADERAMAIAEDHAETHARCVLAVRVDGASRFFREIITGFYDGPELLPEDCAARRRRVAEHLMILTEHCSDPSGKGALGLVPP